MPPVERKNLPTKAQLEAAAAATPAQPTKAAWIRLVALHCSAATKPSVVERLCVEFRIVPPPRQGKIGHMPSEKRP